MYKRIKLLLSILTVEQRRKLLVLQAFVVLTAFAELASVLAIGPFMALVGDMEILHGAGRLADIYRMTELSSPVEFLFYMGITVIVVLACASLISIYTTWRLSLYGSQIGAEISVRLYKYYMYQPWLFHACNNSSTLSSKIAQEAGRVTNQIIQPLMVMNSKLVMALVLAAAIFSFNPIVAIVGVVIFMLAYVLLYRVVRGQLVKNGKNITHANKERFRLMNEGFGGIKDTLLLGRQDDFNLRYERSSLSFGRAQGLNKALSQSPRYLMELIAFGSVIFLILYLLQEYESDLGSILPVLSVYALAGFKLLPAFQQLYASLTQIKSSLSAFDCLKNDLLASSYEDFKTKTNTSLSLSLEKDIHLHNVTFQYPGKNELALNGIDIIIPVHKTIGFVGASGSGKSTAIDILLGLISPTSGELLVDGKLLQGESLRAWQNNVGFVPQSIFLSDSSIRENIAFGLPNNQIDDSKVKKAVRMAHLNELIDNLPDGLDTQIGERGVQLSGGQRQRIGIARALYEDAEVLVLDEATSALDGITEKLVMEAINNFAGNKTIVVIAHRLTTLKGCDNIFILDKGKVIDNGTYEYLIKKNIIFRNMASEK